MKSKNNKNMDLKLVKNILTLISESEVDEVSIEEGDFKIKVKKKSESNQQTVHYQMPVHQQPTPAAQPASPAPAPSPTETKTDAGSDEKTDGEVVRSPIVGTFYEAASPDADPFVKVGDHIKKGQTLCIVEAMKIMNEIEAEFSGTIQKIVAQNGTPVEFDQPLFIIKKD